MTDDQVKHILDTIAEPDKTAAVVYCQRACGARWRTVLVDHIVEQGQLRQVSEFKIDLKNGSRVLLVSDEERPEWRRGIVLATVVYD